MEVSRRKKILVSVALSWYVSVPPARDRMCPPTPTSKFLYVKALLMWWYLQWGLWEVIRSWGWSPMIGLVSLQEESYFLSSSEETMRGLSINQKEGFTSTQLCWHSDLRLPVSRAVRNKFLFISHPVYRTLLQRPELYETIFIKADKV